MRILKSFFQSSNGSSSKYETMDTGDTAMTSQELIEFYEGKEIRGRTLSQILAWDSDDLENKHDYIQTMFPLPEGSPFEPDAPLVNKHMLEAFHGREDLRKQLFKAFKRMLEFYGLEPFHYEGQFKIIKTSDFRRSSTLRWNKSFDHNHRRITRIIRSLRLLGLECEAIEFYNFLALEAKKASTRTLEIWKCAATRPLNIKPDLDSSYDNDTDVGPEFLREWIAAHPAAKLTPEQ